jgi:hypothetical protein
MGALEAGAQREVHLFVEGEFSLSGRFSVRRQDAIRRAPTGRYPKPSWSLSLCPRQCSATVKKTLA